MISRGQNTTQELNLSGVSADAGTTNTTDDDWPEFITKHTFLCTAPQLRTHHSVHQSTTEAQTDQSPIHYYGYRRGLNPRRLAYSFLSDQRCSTSVCVTLVRCTSLRQMNIYYVVELSFISAVFNIRVRDARTLFFAASDEHFLSHVGMELCALLAKLDIFLR